MRRLLIVDDEAGVGYSFRRVFSSPDVEVESALTAADGLHKVQSAAFDVLVLDVQLPDRNGLDLFREMHALDSKRPIIVITAHGTTDTAIEAMKMGAFEYLMKPLEVEQLSQVIERAFIASEMMRTPALLPTEVQENRIIGRSIVIQEMSKSIGRIAPQDVNVLILGETGAGKELVARAIYHHSRRSTQPFLAINCAAIPEALLESELFGHEEGAFTGASRRRVGKFEQCAGGTLFLDEIGDMALPLQAKVLRVLQEHEFEPLGSNRTVKSRARILAATNHNLEKSVSEGKFRKDLYYRLRDVAIMVPPLRSRKDDIPELAHHFLFLYSRDMNRDIRGFSEAALAAIVNYDWPGNVRELQGVIKQAILASVGHLVEVADFPVEISNKSIQTLPGGPRDSLDIVTLVETLLNQNEKGVYDTVLREVEKVLLTRVLLKTQNNQLQASEILGLNRATLRSKLRDLGLTFDKVLTRNLPIEGRDR